MIDCCFCSYSFNNINEKEIHEERIHKTEKFKLKII